MIHKKYNNSLKTNLNLNNLFRRKKSQYHHLQELKIKYRSSSTRYMKKSLKKNNLAPKRKKTKAKIKKYSQKQNRLKQKMLKISIFSRKNKILNIKNQQALLILNKILFHNLTKKKAKTTQNWNYLVLDKVFTLSLILICLKVKMEKKQRERTKA